MMDNICAIATAYGVGAISIVLFGSLFFLNNKFTSVQESTNKYMSWKQTAFHFEF